MKYFELNLSINPNNEAAADVLAALLAEAGCDTFLPNENGLTAYVLQDGYDEEAIRNAVDAAQATFPKGLNITFTLSEAPDENWNATWEAEHHFEPIPLHDGQLIQIVPRQAFGSGEHATTRMMISLLEELNPQNATVIDAGCGTGILGIAAMKLGAKSVFAYDIDEWSVRNAEENYALNGTQASLVLGDASVLKQAPRADIVMANINRNILLADMEAFVNAMQPKGYLQLSGFYEEDIEPLKEKASALGLKYMTSRSSGDWRALLFYK